VNRLGFCCKWIDHLGQVNGIGINDTAKQFNSRTTTVSWLNRQTRAVAEQRLWELMIHNINSVKLLVERVGGMDDNLRMVRVSSDLLPVYTHHDFKYFWNQTDVRDYASQHFAEIGNLARNLGVRLSFHPGQFCVLASDNVDIVRNSIEEFEYHVDMARWMGYGSTWHDHGFKINVHISGRGGPEGVRRALLTMSPEARNLITIENEEMSWGLDDCLSLANDVAIVLDLHHNWVREGEYIQPDSDRVRRVVDSWRGVRPSLHYSVSRSDLLVGHDPDQLPDHKLLIESGFNKQKLRAHSDTMWNRAVNRWALSFWDDFDIQVEAKGKNLATKELYEQSKKSLTK